jgi:hypothetical protein
VSDRSNLSTPSGITCSASTREESTIPVLTALFKKGIKLSILSFEYTMSTTTGRFSAKLRMPAVATSAWGA